MADNIVKNIQIPEEVLKAENITYDNTNSKLKAGTTQEAIDELKNNVSNVPNVATNDQTPTYTVASTLANLTSGEKLSVAFGKIAKAIASLITHLADTTIHFTAAERTKLANIATGAQVNTVTGVKGNAESSYRTGNINITPANIGLGNVNNTADSAKSVKYAATAGSAPASDVYSWAKASSKPSYTKAEVGLGNVDNTADSAKSVKYAATAGSAPASDVYSWAKASSKPSYTKAEVGLGNVDNTADSAKSVKYATSAGSANSATTAASCTGNSATAGTATYAHYAANSTPATYSVKNIAAGTTALTAGSTALATGHIYLQYE